MKLATYNQLGGCNGKSLSEFLKVHVLHELKQYRQFEKYSDIGRTIQTVSQANADVLGISEVFGKRQMEKLQEALGAIGYVDFHVGQGHGLSGSSEYVETLLATKAPSTQVFTPEFDVPAQLGFGGGVVGAYVKMLDLYVIQAHLPLSGGKTRAELDRQMRVIMDEIHRIKETRNNPKIVLMGDFNMTFPALVKDFPGLSKCEKLSSDEPTCSMTNILRIVYRKNIDHILGFGVSPLDAGIIEGASDHALVWADVE